VEPGEGADVTQAEIAGSSKAIIRNNPVRSLAKAVLLLGALADEREATPRRLSGCCTSRGQRSTPC